jgi:hypothetical protein
MAKIFGAILAVILVGAILYFGFMTINSGSRTDVSARYKFNDLLNTANSTSINDNSIPVKPSKLKDLEFIYDKTIYALTLEENNPSNLSFALVNDPSQLPIAKIYDLSEVADVSTSDSAANAELIATKLSMPGVIAVSTFNSILIDDVTYKIYSSHFGEGFPEENENSACFSGGGSLQHFFITNQKLVFVINQSYNERVCSGTRVSYTINPDDKTVNELLSIFKSIKSTH